ncbi:RidA family protein [Cytobacillus oceanisediminis]|uniref:RidA family protein n=1 Tax=Cytobacillus oceanisediminis TaxID=665099 RepID=UPI001C213569|nr:RidA family protein [Cytobacillus oceanisediminis]MBU8772094.1 RidA family protein [Cytobacillus oceanisediminis]
MRQRTSSCSSIEKKIGHSRSVRIGQYIAVSGTAALMEDGEVASLDVRKQAKSCLTIIQKAIEDLGGKKEDIIRTRIMLKDIKDWDTVVEVHRDFFSNIHPACTVIEVSNFIKEEWLVEIEADCIL